MVSKKSIDIENYVANRTNSRDVPTLDDEDQEILDDIIRAGSKIMIGPEKPDGLVGVYEEIGVDIGWRRHVYILTAPVLSLVCWDRARFQEKLEERERVREWAMGVEDLDLDEHPDGTVAPPSTPNLRAEVENPPEVGEESQELEEQSQEMEGQPQEVEEQPQEMEQQLEIIGEWSENLPNNPQEALSSSIPTFTAPVAIMATAQPTPAVTTACKKNTKKRGQEIEGTAASKRSRRIVGEEPHLPTWEKRWWEEKKRVRRGKKQD
ncbi:MAG: hypothetical protein Q9187_006708 [Circinaria calcarea]